MRLNHVTFLLAAVLFFGLNGLPVLAAELPPGTVINAQNIDKLKNDVFEGKTIGSMIPEKMELMIRKWGLTLKLRHSGPYVEDPRYIAATKKYSGEVKYDRKTRIVSGYQAGDPFPSLSLNDPDLATKVIWRYYYGWPGGDIMDYQSFNYVLVDGVKGVERMQHWYFLRVYYKRLLSSEKPILGDGSILQKTLIGAIYPRDIAGLGTFSVRYDSDKYDDQWAYVKSVRRVRRLAGSAWMDSPGGNDQLADDVIIFNAYPAWYPAYKFLGKRWIFGIAHAKSTYNAKKAGTPEEYPGIDMAHPPYWNPVDEWEPREVYVIEATAPKEHPYSKKIIYFDAGYSTAPYVAEIYDRKGEFWKYFIYNWAPFTDDTGKVGFVDPVQGNHFDVQRRHGTIWVANPKINTKGITTEKMTLGELEKLGK